MSTTDDSCIRSEIIKVMNAHMKNFEVISEIDVKINDAKHIKTLISDAFGNSSHF